MWVFFFSDFISSTKEFFGKNNQKKNYDLQKIILESTCYNIV